MDSKTTPISVKMELESIYKNKLNFKEYLHQGYKYYLKWLKMTVGSGYSSYLNFCLARNMNKFKPYIMGLDLEIRYVIKRLENIFGRHQMKHYEGVIHQTLRENFNLSDIHIKSVIDSYFNHPQEFELGLSDEEFNKRLHAVDTLDLDKHSFNCWRNSNPSKLNEKPYPITREDILNGENLAPPSARHIGLQMLSLNGLLPTSIMDPKLPKNFSVTFI
jgi:hypothetical protein